MPYNPCNDRIKNLNTPLAKEVASMGSGYRQKFCFRLCMLHHLEAACDCALPEQFGLNGTDTCDKECIDLNVKKFDHRANCEDDCPVECDTTSYDLKKETVKISEDPSFSRMIEKKLIAKRRENREYLSNYTAAAVATKLIHFEINFESLSFTQVSELPKRTVANFIADLGGVIGKFYSRKFSEDFPDYYEAFSSFKGVFLGLSVISFVEIFELIYRIICILLAKDK